MAKSFISAGVFTNEIDESFLGAGVGAIGAGLIGTAPMGPAFVPVVVTNNSEFVEYFGDLDTDHMLGYAARSYLRNAGVANIVRVLGPAGRTVNGVAVTPGYTAESVAAIVGITGSSTAVIHALLELSGAATISVNDLDNDKFDLRISSSAGSDTFTDVAVTASFLSGSPDYIGKVLNTDPTKFYTFGYYVRDIYDYAFKTHGEGNATYVTASYALTDYAVGFNSGSSPWIKSQVFGGSVEYNLFKIHTLGHGIAENGRYKISVNNVRPSSAPSVSEFGKFDLEVRTYGDTDRSRNIVESFPNVTLDPADPNYLPLVVGDRFFQFDPDLAKMVEFGQYSNGSRLIRVEMTTEAPPNSALPWGFRGLDKPGLGYVSGSDEDEGELAADVDDSMLDLPYVADLLDKTNQAETQSYVYWGVEFDLSGSVKSRLTYLPTMTGSDADFSLTNVSGNTESTFVYNASNPVGSQKSPGESNSHTALASTYAKFTVPLAFGFDGFDVRKSNPLDNGAELAGVSQLGTQALRQGVDIVSNPDFIDINLLAIPDIYSSRVVDYAILAMEDRADVFYVADISGTTSTAAVQEVRGRGFDSNYSAVYYPGITVLDPVNGGFKSVPASVPAVGAIAYNDRVGYPWFAPAGLNRAGLGPDVIGFTVGKVNDFLTQDERDDLYENRINPIARFPDVPQGVIWGQKTLQLKSSALDRINVRRLLIRAKKLIASATKFLVFEANNATTQTRFRQLVNPILSDIQIKQGLEQFKVVMDETTNPPELIDRNIMAGKVFLVPTRTAEFISIDFIISPSGASFDE